MGIRLVLVRHGLSSFNAKGLIQGRTDESLLTDEGYEQARKAGKALSKINFDKIYSSPLVRAAETAKTIKKTQFHSHFFPNPAPRRRCSPPSWPHRRGPSGAPRPKRGRGTRQGLQARPLPPFFSVCASV